MSRDVYFCMCDSVQSEPGKEVWQVTQPWHLQKVISQPCSQSFEDYLFLVGQLNLKGKTGQHFTKCLLEQTAKVQKLENILQSHC